MRKLLLHICCGPCATAVIGLLRDRGYDVTGYFSNPNIHPAQEYEKRLAAARTVAEKTALPLIEDGYDAAVFIEAVRGYGDEPENGARCPICYRLRLKRTAEYAAGHGFGSMATTLTVGTQKKAAVINPIGIEEAGRAGIEFVEGDWKKRDGFKTSCELTREYGIYRQHYCGCLYSLRDRTSSPENGE